MQEGGAELRFLASTGSAAVHRCNSSSNDLGILELMLYFPLMQLYLHKYIVYIMYMYLYQK